MGIKTGLEEFLLSLGLDLKLIIAGFGGGVVHTFFFRQTDPYTVVSSVVSGIFAANYLAPTLSSITNLSLGTCGFVAGFGAMALVQGLTEMVKLKIGLASKDSVDDQRKS